MKGKHESSFGIKFERVSGVADGGAREGVE